MREFLHKEIDIVLVAITSPIQIGIYKNDKLIKVIKSSEKASEFLPKVFSGLLHKYKIRSIVYARGPGSFMAIKLTYIFLKTLSLAKNIEIKACDAFVFSKNLPIKAVGNLYFIKKGDKIEVQKIKNGRKNEFYLPEKISDILFSENLEPLYILPAV